VEHETNPDVEMQQELGRMALGGLDNLLNALPPATPVDAHAVGAIVRLIGQAIGVRG
jgi:hypothetical protein